MEYLLKALNAQPGLTAQPSGQPLKPYRADQLVLPSLELEGLGRAGAPHQGLAGRPPPAHAGGWAAGPSAPGGTPATHASPVPEFPPLRPKGKGTVRAPNE